MPALRGVLETALYVDDLARARGFYEEVLGLEAAVSDERFCAFEVASGSILLLFARGSAPGVLERLARGFASSKLDVRAAQESCARVIGSSTSSSLKYGSQVQQPPGWGS